MKQTYDSINATFGSSALDLSTLPAYGRSSEPTSRVIPLPGKQGYGRASNKNTTKKSSKGLFDKVASFLVNDSLIAPLFFEQCVESPKPGATKAQCAFAIIIATCVFVAINLF